MDFSEADDVKPPEGKAIPPRREGGQASFLQRLQRRFGHDVDPSISLQPEEADVTESQSVTKGLYLKLSDKDPASLRYKVKHEIARGGMGAILRVWDDDLRRNLAMKVLIAKQRVDELDSGPQPINEELLSRFLEEAQITGQLDHPGIVPVHDLGLDERGRVYFTMRLVRGRDLKEILELLAEGKEGWTRTKALHVLLKVCEAMAFAHEKNVVHRDLKPANIMVGRFGETYVMDWGLARVLGRRDSRDLRLTEDASALSLVRTVRQDDGDSDPESPLRTMDGDVIGTPSYMAPEQAEGRLDEVGKRSDVYSIGTILYQMLTGQAPYVKPGAKMSPHTVLLRALEGPPTPIDKIANDVPAELVAICEKAMARDPEHRYGRMLDLAADIEAFLEGRVVTAYEGGSVAEARKWIQRNRGMAAAIGVAALLAIGGGAGVMAVQTTKASQLQQANADLTAAKSRAEDKEQDANEASQAAKLAADEADEARQLADDKTHEAMASLDIARQSNYMSNIRAAEYSFRLHEVSEAEALLSRCDPELRGWEWRHLSLKLEGHQGSPISLTTPIGKVLPTGWGDRALVLTDNGRLYVYEVGDNAVLRESVLDKFVWSLSLRDYVDFDLSPDDETAAVVGRRTDRVVLLDAYGLGDSAPDPDQLFVPLEIDAGDGGFLPPEGLEIPELSDAPEVTCARFGAVDDLLAVGYENGVVLLWDYAARELLYALEGHDGAVHDLAWSPDGDLLASASEDGDVRLWRALDGEGLRVLSGHEGAVYAAEFSPDGSLVATGSDDGRVRIWDTSSGRIFARHDGHTAAVLALAFRPDGLQLVSGGADQTLQVWDGDTEQVRAIFGHEERVRTLAFTPDGSLVLSGGDDGTFRSWDPDLGGAFTDLLSARHRGIGSSRRMGHITAVDFHPGGVLCLTGHNDGTISIWDTWSGELVNVLRGHTHLVSHAVWSSDGASILSSSLDKTAILWDVQAGRPRETFSGHRSWIRASALAPDGSWVVTASGDRSARVWDVASGQTLHKLEGHKGWVNATLISVDGTRIWTGSRDRVLRNWSVETGELVREIEFDSEIRRLAQTADGALLAVGCGDGTLIVIETTSGVRLFALEGEEVPVTAMDFSHAGTRLVVGKTDGLLRIYNSRTGDHLLTLRGHSGEISGVSFDADDARVLTSSDSSNNMGLGIATIGRSDQVARIWETGALVERRESRSRAATVRARAQPLVDSLFASYFFMAEVLARLDSMGMPSEVRLAAKRIARVRGDDPLRLAEDTWSVVRAPGASERDYKLAVSRAEAAVALDPENRFCLIVLGAAQYRRGFVPGAVQSLTAAAKLSGGDVRSNVALHSFAAMAHHSLGHDEDALRHLGLLRSLSPGLALFPRETATLEALIEEAGALADRASESSAPGAGG
ncbi:MAG: protein kinase [Planctomycetota bacterium]